MSRIKQDVRILVAAVSGRRSDRIDKSSAPGEAYWRITVSNNEIDSVALVMDGYNAAVVLVPSAVN